MIPVALPPLELMLWKVTSPEPMFVLLMLSAVAVPESVSYTHLTLPTN